MPVMLWCSASQYRWKPSASACWARSRELRSDSPGLEPRATGDRSSTENGIIRRHLRERGGGGNAHPVPMGGGGAVFNPHKAFRGNNPFGGTMLHGPWRGRKIHPFTHPVR